MATVSAAQDSVLWILVITGLTLIYGSYSVLVNLTKINGQIPFFSSSLILVIEVVKLLFCLLLITPSLMRVETLNISVWGIMPYSLPALCYSIINNLSIFLQTQMDPVTYMVLGNFKTLSTGLLYQVLMKKKLSSLQWVALGLLILGGTINSVTALNADLTSLADIHCTWLGLGIMALYCCISGFAGVFTEYKFKSSIKLTLMQQNALLYLFGVFFNSILCMWQMFQRSKESEANESFQFFGGFSFIVWILVVTQSVAGLGVSLIVMYKSNITRVFIISSSPLVTTVLSYFFINLNIQPLFLFAVSLIVFASFMYNLGKDVSKDVIPFHPKEVNKNIAPHPTGKDTTLNHL